MFKGIHQREMVRIFSLYITSLLQKISHDLHIPYQRLLDIQHEVDERFSRSIGEPTLDAVSAPLPHTEDNTRDAFMLQKVNDLRKLCTEKGLSRSGNKTALVDRLVSFYSKQEEEAFEEEEEEEEDDDEDDDDPQVTVPSVDGDEEDNDDEIEIDLDFEDED